MTSKPFKAATIGLAALFLAMIVAGLFVARTGSDSRPVQGNQAVEAGEAREGGETIPPSPKAYFNDNAGVVSAAVGRQLDDKLRAFEQETSNQVMVAIYPKMQSDTSIEDYTNRVAAKWKVGQAKRDNGAVLFVFVQDRAMYIQVGYGLEGALPDALAKQIIEGDIIPQIRAGNWDGALQQGVDSILAATKGEYKGTGRPIGGGGAKKPAAGAGFFVLFVIIFILSGVLRGRRGYEYGHSGFGRSWGGGGGFGGGGGGGFSGGGGGFGGGGAGGRW